MKIWGAVPNPEQTHTNSKTFPSYWNYTYFLLSLWSGTLKYVSCRSNFAIKLPLFSTSFTCLRPSILKQWYGRNWFNNFKFIFGRYRPSFFSLRRRLLTNLFLQWLMQVIAPFPSNSWIFCSTSIFFSFDVFMPFRTMFWTDLIKVLVLIPLPCLECFCCLSVFPNWAQKMPYPSRKRHIIQKFH